MLKLSPVRITIIIGLLLTGTWALAENINQEMQKAGNAMTQLIPYIYDDVRFRAPENRDLIQQQLNQLIQSMETAPGLMKDHGVSQQISQSSLLNQLKQAKTLFKTGNYATAQYLLGSAPTLCSNCHVQDGISATHAPQVKRNIFANAFSYAEFNYHIRNYKEAESAYLNYLAQHDVYSSMIMGAKTLERLLDITLLTDGDIPLSQKKLEHYQKLKDLNPDLVVLLGRWQEGLLLLPPTASTPEAIEQGIYREFSEGFSIQHEFILDETRRPLALIWRAELQSQIKLASSALPTARLLYLIAILERMLGDQTELSLANLYLKECIKLKVEIYSHKCLSEYDGHLGFYYGGSDGDSLPKAAADELKRLRHSLRTGI